VNKRINSAFLIVAVFCLAFLGVPAQSTATRFKPQPERAAADQKPANKVTVEKIEMDMAEALTVIQDNHADGKNLDYNDLFKASIEGMLRALDPHSNYYDPKEFDQFRTEQRSEYFGVGATIGDLREGNTTYTYIKSTFENAPANRAGLRYGDKILDVNGVSMVGKAFSEVRTHLRGPRGTAAKVTIQRYATGKTETVEIVRDAVAQPSIPEAYMIRPGIGYIAMTGGFNQTTANEFREGLTRLKEQGLESLIIDLRGNGGGLVGQAYRIANTFLNSGQIVFTQKGRVRGASESYRAENRSPEQVPIVLLQNRGSASASEILAGALQDHDRALIVGENSFGKGLVQNPFVFTEYGSMLLLTIAKYETPSGRLIQRDYSDGNLYSYYSQGGTLREENSAAKPSGAETKTDLGRSVYSGGGITPDEVVKPDTITPEQVQLRGKLTDPLFAFSLELIHGGVAGFESMKLEKPQLFNYDLKPGEYAVTDPLYQAFKKFALEKYKISGAQVDKERAFVERIIRTELATAAYGLTTSFQVANEYDNQLRRSIELMPKARELAAKAAAAYKAKQNLTASGTN
jgi:carboxyl-terminal processing protease